MNDKRGQFFIITAVVIVAVIVSIVTISNYTQKKEVVKLYDLGEELGIESQHVLDYGTYNELNDTQMKILMSSFIQNYVSYIGEDKNIYFIFGNKDKINVVGYQDVIEEKVEVCFDGEEDCTTYLQIGETQEFFKGDGSEGDIDEVVIKIADIDYKFRLKEGENFYFIIWQEISGEKYVVTNEEE